MPARRQTRDEKSGTPDKRPAVPLAADAMTRVSAAGEDSAFRPARFQDARLLLEDLTGSRSMDRWADAQVPDARRRPISYADSVAEGFPSWTSEAIPLRRIAYHGKWSREAVVSALKEATRELGPGRSLSSYRYRQLEAARGWPRATTLPKLARSMGTTAAELRREAMLAVHGRADVLGQGARTDLAGRASG